ncbi:hypothetical protein LCGC14_2380460 [marine sediment metagenome]|uniref:Uncharacterized protein n=1 Tax=marine sediment metagenome TaxID=412755 RepID=A0A0F9CN90_9ZZZZ
MKPAPGDIQVEIHRNVATGEVPRLSSLSDDDIERVYVPECLTALGRKLIDDVFLAIRGDE